MKNSLSFLLLFLATQLFASNGFAQVVSLVDANKLFDFTEQNIDPVLFSPPAETQQLNEVGSDWYLRVYPDSGILLAVNANGTGSVFCGSSVGAGRTSR